MIENYYTHDVTVYTVTEGISSVTGENTRTNSTGTAFKVRVRPITNQESFYQDKNNLEITHFMYSTISTFFNQSDRVVYDGSTYEIQGITNPMGMNRYQRTTLKAAI